MAAALPDGEAVVGAARPFSTARPLSSSWARLCQLALPRVPRGS